MEIIIVSAPDFDYPELVVQVSEIRPGAFQNIYLDMEAREAVAFETYNDVDVALDEARKFVTGDL